MFDTWLRAAKCFIVQRCVFRYVILKVYSKNNKTSHLEPKTLKKEGRENSQ